MHELSGLAVLATAPLKLMSGISFGACASAGAAMGVELKAAMGVELKDLLGAVWTARMAAEVSVSALKICIVPNAKRRRSSIPMDIRFALEGAFRLGGMDNGHDL